MRKQRGLSLGGFMVLCFILIFVAIGVTVSDQVASIFKHGVERLRPCHDPLLEHHMRIVKCGGQFGFYSAHASNTFFLATYLTILSTAYTKPKRRSSGTFRGAANRNRCR